MEYRANAAEALRLVQTRRFADAVPLLRRLLHETYVTDFEYDDWLRHLADSHKALGSPLPAGYVYLYLHYFDLALECFERAASPLDLALCHESRGRHREAAQLYLDERKLVRAAVNLEAANLHAEARPLWERLRAQLDPVRDPYPAALACMNLAHCLAQLGEVDGERRRVLVAALVLLESLADEREQDGMLDEALDCYHLMIQIGIEQQAFENLSEGYINAIRLLQERGRLLTALRYYAGIGQVGAEWGEYHAVATLYREAAEAVQRAGMLYGDYYVRAAAEAWSEVARRNVDAGIAPELSENALLASLDGYNQLDDGQAVSRCYQLLAELPLAPERVARYRKLAERATREVRAPAELYTPSPILLRPPRIPPLWREDLLEWEGGEDPIVMLTQVVWDLNYHDTVRRRALNLVLHNLDARERGAGIDAQLDTEVAKALAHMRPKLAFRGLRRLAEHAVAQVRAEAMRSAGQLNHPSGLLVLEGGLHDDDRSVRQAALESLGRHGYPEAFDALKRIFESHESREVRSQVLVTMGKVRAFESAEYLYRMLAGGLYPELAAELRQSFESALTPEWRRVFTNRARVEGGAASRQLAFLTR